VSSLHAMKKPRILKCSDLEAMEYLARFGFVDIDSAKAEDAMPWASSSFKRPRPTLRTR
jgi:hypothetical protein